MIAVGIGNYGTAAGTSERMDLSELYTRLSAEIALFAGLRKGVPPHAHQVKDIVAPPK